MGRASICPVCKKPVELEQTVYTIDEQDYHPGCYELREPEAPEPGRDRDGG